MHLFSLYVFLPAVTRKYCDTWFIDRCAKTHFLRNKPVGSEECNEAKGAINERKGEPLELNDEEIKCTRDDETEGTTLIDQCVHPRYKKDTKLVSINKF